MARRTNLLAALVLAAVVMGPGWGAIAAPNATGGSAVALTTLSAPEPGVIQLAQAIPPECLELKQNEPKDPQQKLVWLKDLIDCVKKRDVTPPKLRINAPDVIGPGEESYEITGFVGDDDGEPRLVFNGEALDITPAGDGAPDLGKNIFAFSYTVAVGEPGEHRFVIQAEDESGNRIAEEVVVSVVSVDQPMYDGTFFALIIANGDYDMLPEVPTALADGRSLAEVLVRRYEFDKENVTLLENASRRDMLGSLSQLRKDLGIDDRLLIYYTGHGFYDEAIGAGFWLPADADERDDFTWVAIDSVNRNLKGMAEASAKHVLVIADSVYPVPQSRGSARRKRDAFFENIDAFVSRKRIASGVTTPVVNQASGNHSVFAFALLKVLRDNQDPYITSKQLFDRLSREMSVYTEVKAEWGTLPNTGDEGSGEFTFILRSASAGAGQ